MEPIEQSLGPVMHEISLYLPVSWLIPIVKKTARKSPIKGQPNSPYWRRLTSSEIRKARTKKQRVLNKCGVVLKKIKAAIDSHWKIYMFVMVMEIGVDYLHLALLLSALRILPTYKCETMDHFTHIINLRPPDHGALSLLLAALWLSNVRIVRAKSSSWVLLRSS